MTNRRTRRLLECALRISITIRADRSPVVQLPSPRGGRTARPRGLRKFLKLKLRSSVLRVYPRSPPLARAIQHQIGELLPQGNRRALRRRACPKLRLSMMDRYLVINHLISLSIRTKAWALRLRRSISSIQHSISPSFARLLVLRVVRRIFRICAQNSDFCPLDCVVNPGADVAPVLPQTQLAHVPCRSCGSPRSILDAASRSYNDGFRSEFRVLRYAPRSRRRLVSPHTLDRLDLSLQSQLMSLLDRYQYSFNAFADGNSGTPGSVPTVAGSASPEAMQGSRGHQ